MDRAPAPADTVRHLLLKQDQARRALELATVAVERWPNSWWVHGLAGRCHADLGELELAEAAYRRSLALKVQTTTLSFLADVLRSQGRSAESLVLLHAVIEIDPDYEEAHYNIGCELRLAGDYGGAIERFRRAIEIDPDYACAHAELGFAVVLDAKDERGEARERAREVALQHLTRAVELDPTYHWARIYLGLLLWELERLREARIHYAAAAELRPDSGHVLALYAGFLSSAFGASPRVDAMFERALELDPGHDAVHYEHGKHLLRAGRHAAARRALLRSDELGNDRALALLASSEGGDG